MPFKIKASAIFIACVAFAVCLIEALGGGYSIGSICATAGCSLTSGVSLFGVSLYYFGALALAGYIVLALVCRTWYLLLFSILFVAIDTLLLTYLALGSPCISCLIVGTLFFTLFLLAWKGHFGWFFRGHHWGWLRKAAVVVCGLWICAAAPNLLGVVQETVAPKPIYGSNDAPVKIFFSPTCPACKDMVRKAVQPDEQKVALYPVAHSEEDIERMCILDCQLGEGAKLEEALDKCWSGQCTSKEHGFWQEARLTLISQVNLTYLLNMGKTEVPVMVSKTTPETAPAQGGVDIEFDESTSSPLQDKGSAGCEITQESGCSSL